MRLSRIPRMWWVIFGKAGGQCENLFSSPFPVGTCTLWLLLAGIRNKKGARPLISPGGHSFDWLHAIHLNTQPTTGTVTKQSSWLCFFFFFFIHQKSAATRRKYPFSRRMLLLNLLRQHQHTHLSLWLMRLQICFFLRQENQRSIIGQH